MPKIIGIAGGSCSGKTTLIEELKQNSSKNDVSFVSFDDYFDVSKVSGGQIIEDWETPGLYRREDFITDLRKLRLGESIQFQANSREAEASGERMKTVETKPLIIIEGFLIFHWPEARDQFDLKLFLDLPEDVMIQRRLVRAKSPTKWDHPDYINSRLIPGYRHYVLPQKKYIDVALDGQLPTGTLANEINRLIDQLI